MENYRITPERISTLQPGQIFVFGRNTLGMHAGGAARFALDRFGAVHPFFRQALDMPNVYLPEPFLKVLLRQ